MVIDEIKDEFLNHVIPFWMGLRDDEFGGYYGLLDIDLNLDKKAPKGCILNSRIMWFFSNAYKVLGDPVYLDYAKHSFDFMKQYCFDEEYGGVYWSLTYDGKVDDSTKHTYNQAFSVYALSSYAEVSKDPEALELAYKLYDLIEKKCKDSGGYLEAFTREFEPAGNDKLSENGVEAGRTMNTHLHIMEAYSELYRVGRREDVRQSLIDVLEIYKNKIYDPAKKRLEVFFDKDFNSIIDLYSYGHDIEASWLADRSVEELNLPELKKEIEEIDSVLADSILKIAFTGEYLPQESENGVVLKLGVWWVQVEAMVGFLNAYQKHPERTDYLDAVVKEWEYIKNYLVDSRDGSEWLSEIDENHIPVTRKPIVEPWKCPYHTGRMFFEVLTRGVNF